MFFPFFRLLKEKRAKRAQEEIDKIKSVEKSMELSIDNYKKEMTESPCAINGMNTCTSKCIHFKEGYVRWTFFPPGPAWPQARFPECKLWN